jgi:hypothetical protein
MPHEIKVGDVYQTRDGRSARIIATDRDSTSYPIVALLRDRRQETVQTYTRDGRFRGANSLPLVSDLVIPECYDDWKIDDPIWVWDDRTISALPRHFAGLDENGKVLAWPDGSTSHTKEGFEPTPWQYASKTKP